MSEWVPALTSLAGFVGFLLLGSVYWIGIRLGRLEADEPVGPFGCAWAVACGCLILAGFMLQFAR